MLAKVEHLFLVIKLQFGGAKVYPPLLVKNTTRLTTLFAHGNLCTARRKRTMLSGERYAKSITKSAWRRYQANLRSELGDANWRISEVFSK